MANSLTTLALESMTKACAMGHRWLLAIALSLLSFATLAGQGAVRKQIEASMRVTGTIEVAADGSVRTYAIDEADKLPAGVLSFIQENIDSWKFDPVLVDGKAVAIRNKMHLRVVAKKQDDDNYTIRLQAASFDPFKVEDGHEIARKSMSPPRFPEEAAKSRAEGTVYLVLKVGRDGTVQDVVTEQINLRIVGSEGQMERWRNLFGMASMQAARRWQFILPVAGENADDPYWTIRVPIDFKFPPDDIGYGQWEAYVPGPRQKHPWSGEGDDESPEALAAGGIHLVRNGGLRLRTPLGTEG